MKKLTKIAILTTLIIALTTPVYAAWLGTWAKRIEITVDSTNIDSDLTHFPVPITLGISVGQSNQDVSKIFDEVGSSWQKIAVTKSDGTTQIYAEKEKWDSTAEEAVLWVSKSDLTLSSSGDTLYIYYDSTQSDNTTYVADVGSRTEVWDSNYGGVWHLAEDPSGTAPQMIDSTSNNNDGTSQGTMLSEDLVSGQIDGALDLDGSDDYVDISHDSSLMPTSITVSVWVKTTADSGMIVGKYSDYNIYMGSGKARIEIDTPDSGTHNEYGSTDINNGNYHLVEIYYDSSDGSNGLYVDGSFDTDISGMSGDIEANTNPVGIGARQGSFPFPGQIDEVRINSTALSSAWRKADYYAQDDNLLTYGSEETESVGQIMRLNIQ